MISGNGGAPPTRRAHLRVRRIFALLGILIVAIAGTVGVASKRAEGVGVLEVVLIPIALVLVSTAPFLFYVTDVRSLSSSVITGLALVATTLGVLTFVFTSSHPFAFFGLILLPLVNLLILAVGLAVDFMRFGPSPVRPSSARAVTRERVEL